MILGNDKSFSTAREKSNLNYSFVARCGIRTLACAAVTYNPLYRERKLATAASRQLVAGFEGLFQRRKKNTRRDALGVLFSGVRYGIRTHGLQGHNLTR